MTSAEDTSSTFPEDTSPEPQRGRVPPDDIDLSIVDRNDLLDAIANLFSTYETASRLLTWIGYPAQRLPAFDNRSALDAWQDIFHELYLGIIRNPYRQLLSAALRSYPHNTALRSLAERYGLDQEIPGETSSVPEYWHVVVRAESEADREHAAEVLAQLSLEPVEAWASAHVASYRVSLTDAESTRDRLSQTDLGWTLVAPGEPHYLFHSVVAFGPGGRQFRFTDTPAQQTVGSLAAEVVAQYPAALGDRPTMVDHVSGERQPRRLNPDETLHDAGIRDGDRLRVGFERRAGGQFFYYVNINFETHDLDLRQFTFLLTAIDELYAILTPAMAVKLNEDPSSSRSPQLRSIVMQSPLTMVLGATGGAVSLAALRVLAAVLRDPGMLGGFLPKVKTGWYDGRTAEYEARLRLQTVRALAGNVNVQVSSVNPPEAEARELQALSAGELGNSPE